MTSVGVSTLASGPPEPEPLVAGDSFKLSVRTVVAPSWMGFVPTGVGVLNAMLPLSVLNPAKLGTGASVARDGAYIHILPAVRVIALVVPETPPDGGVK